MPVTVLPSAARPRGVATSHSVGLAIANQVTAIFLFAVMNVMVKWLSESYPLSQVIFCRALFAIVTIWPMIHHNGGWRSLLTTRPWGHAWRCGAGVTAMFAGFTAISLLPLANAVALSFTAPLFITLLGVLVLGERVGWRRALAIAIGFGGVLIMLGPRLWAPTNDGDSGTATMVLGSALALTGAFFAAIAMISIRRLSSTEPGTTIVFWFMATACLVSGVQLPFQAVMPTAVDAAMFVAIGILGGVAQVCLTRAYRGAPVAVVAPFDYTAMVWASLFGFLVWGDLPDLWVAGGAVLVVASGVYITLREVRLGKAKAPADPARSDLP